jgi:hypothetical protein
MDETFSVYKEQMAWDLFKACVDASQMCLEENKA